MHKLLIASLALALNSCGQNTGPGVPEPLNSSNADGSPEEMYKSGKTTDSLGSDREANPQSNTTVGSSSGELPSADGNTPKTTTPSTPTVPTTPTEPVPDVINKTITLKNTEDRGTWEGWGTSLAGWANGIGRSVYEGVYADAIFSAKDVKILDKTYPGLDLNIVRYQVGGGGQKDDFAAIVETADKVPSNENAHDGFEPYRDLDGFWKDNVSSDVTSTSWDFGRDQNQRSMLELAKNRGADTFEFFSAAPMWWMTDEKSASGGVLSADAGSNYMLYLAAVAKYARSNWGIPVGSIAPFNEPSSGKWRFPVLQQGLNLSFDDQVSLMGQLKVQLNEQAVSDISISSADDRDPSAAWRSHEAMKSKGIDMMGVSAKAADLYGKVNVHTSDNSSPFRNNGERDKLRGSVSGKKLWVTEYNDSDSSGAAMAQSILDDVNHLRPTAWVYAQVIEPYGTKGMINANFHMMPADSNVRGKPTGISAKYFVFAQFSRFIRPGQKILGSSDDKTIVAYDAASKKLTFVSFNNVNSDQTIEFDLSAVKSWNTNATHMMTRVDGSKLYKSKAFKTLTKKIRWTAEPNSISSFEISDVVFN